MKKLNKVERRRCKCWVAVGVVLVVLSVIFAGRGLSLATGFLTSIPAGMLLLDRFARFGGARITTGTPLRDKGRKLGKAR